MNNMAEIQALMQKYFNNLHSGDIAEIDELFLPECDLTCANDDGSLVHLTLQEYKDLIGSRPSPKSKGYPVYGHVVSIDQSGPNTALAKVDCAVQPRYFIDYLALVKTDGAWKIAAKVYYVQKIQE